MKFILLYSMYNGQDYPLYYTADDLDEIMEFIEAEDITEYTIHELGKEIDSGY